MPWLQGAAVRLTRTYSRLPYYKLQHEGPSGPMTHDLVWRDVDVSRESLDNKDEM